MFEQTRIHKICFCMKGIRCKRCPLYSATTKESNGQKHNIGYSSNKIRSWSECILNRNHKKKAAARFISQIGKNRTKSKLKEVHTGSAFPLKVLTSVLDLESAN